MNTSLAVEVIDGEMMRRRRLDGELLLYLVEYYCTDYIFSAVPMSSQRLLSYIIIIIKYIYTFNYHRCVVFQQVEKKRNSSCTRNERIFCNAKSFNIMTFTSVYWQ